MRHRRCRSPIETRWRWQVVLPEPISSRPYKVRVEWFALWLQSVPREIMARNHPVRISERDVATPGGIFPKLLFCRDRLPDPRRPASNRFVTRGFPPPACTTSHRIDRDKPASALASP